MLAVAALLAVLALSLAWPLPLMLSAANWPNRHPAIALALWQAIALLGALSLIGCLVVFGAAPFGSISQAAQVFLTSFDGELPPAVGSAHLLALGVALAIAVHLGGSVTLTAVRAERERRRHHHLIKMLSDPFPGDPNARVIAFATPVAYCVPGLRRRTVLTEGLVNALSPDELRAVIAHEHAHLSQLHHLVLLAFRAWHTALPWFPIAPRAEHAVTDLTEMLADDAARAAAGDHALHSALETLGTGATTGYAGAVVTDRRMLDRRLSRLSVQHPA